METSFDSSDPPPWPCRGALRHAVNNTSSSSNTQVQLQVNTVTETTPPRAHTTRSPVVFSCGSDESEENLNSGNTSETISTAPYLITERVLPEPPSPCQGHESRRSRSRVVSPRRHLARQSQRREDCHANVSSARPPLPSIAEDGFVGCPVRSAATVHGAQRFDSSPYRDFELASCLYSDRRLPLSCQPMRRMERVRSHRENRLSSGTSGDSSSSSSSTSFTERRHRRRWKSRSRKQCLMLTGACVCVFLTAASLIATVFDFVQRGKQEDTNREVWTMSSQVLDFLKTRQEQSEIREDETCLPCLELLCTEKSSVQCRDLQSLQKSLSSATLTCCTRNPSHVVHLLNMMTEGRQKELGFTISEAVRNATASLVKKPKAYATVVVKKPNSSSPGPQEAVLQADHHLAAILNVSIVHNRLYIHTPGLYLVSAQVLFRSASERLDDDLTLTVERYNLRQGRTQVLTQSRHTPHSGHEAPVWYRTVAVVLPALLERGDELALLVSPSSLVFQEPASNYFSATLVSSGPDSK